MWASWLEAFRRGEATPLDVTERCLERIAARDGQLAAWVHVDADGARRAAQEATQRWREGHPKSPIDGMPIGVKDLFDVAGWVTAAGVPWRRTTASRDAALVARLRARGAVVLGKTVTTPLACFDPAPTRHPRDPARTPGGSSAGSAVAVADGHCAVALGTQTGGSIIRPAAFCDIVGFKPSYGILPADGIVPLSPRLDHPGWMVADTEDLVLLGQLIFARPDSSADIRDGARESSSEVRIGDLAGVYEGRVAPDVRGAHRQAVKRLEEGPFQVQGVEWPVAWDAMLEVHRTIMAFEAAQVHAADWRQREAAFPPRVAQLIREGRRTSEADFRAAVQQQEAWRRQIDAWWTDGDWSALLVPACTTAPPKRESTGDPSLASIASLLGLPAVTIPAPHVGKGGGFGLQWMARRGRDLALIELVRIAGSGPLERA